MLRTRFADDLIRNTTTWETNGETHSRKNTPVQEFHNSTIPDPPFSRTSEIFRRSGDNLQPGVPILIAAKPSEGELITPAEIKRFLMTCQL